MLSKDKVVWSIQVPKALDDEVEEVVKKGIHMTKAELIRVAVKLYLQKLRDIE